MIIILLAASTQPFPFPSCQSDTDDNDDDDDSVDPPILIARTGTDDRVVRGCVRHTKEVEVGTEDDILSHYLPIKHLHVAKTILSMTVR